MNGISVGAFFLYFLIAFALAIVTENVSLPNAYRFGLLTFGLFLLSEYVRQTYLLIGKLCG
jgi:hypothetical protein